jgi:glycosyltransferase involved in cell wall biosynthesis
MGKAIITYDAFSHDHGLIHHGYTGLKAKFRSIENIAECIITYLYNNELMRKCGEELKRKAFQNNNWSMVEKKLVEAIEDAIMKKTTFKKNLNRDNSS